MPTGASGTAASIKSRCRAAAERPSTIARAPHNCIPSCGCRQQVFRACGAVHSRFGSELGAGTCKGLRNRMRNGPVLLGRVAFPFIPSRDAPPRTVAPRWADESAADRRRSPRYVGFHRRRRRMEVVRPVRGRLVERNRRWRGARAHRRTARVGPRLALHHKVWRLAARRLGRAHWGHCWGDCRLADSSDWVNHRLVRRCIPRRARARVHETWRT